MAVEDADKRIALCMATYGGPAPETYIASMRMIYAFARRKDWEFAPFIAHRMQCHVGCNASLHFMEQAEEALEADQGFTHVLWLDDDVSLTPENAIRLIEAVDRDHPAVFSLCFYRQWPHRPSIYAYKEWNGVQTELEPLHDYPENELARINAAGLCAAAFDRDIFRHIKKPYFDWFEGGYKRPAMTPDGFLCYRMLEAGIPIHVHTGIDCTHMGHPVAVDEAYAVRHREHW